MGDSARVRQVLVNLLSNAVKFTSAGEVIVEVTSKPLSADDCELDVAVHDTGIGIPEERRDRLFQTFTQAETSTTREYGGTGLGLAICKRLVEAMHGDIRYESRGSSGSTFRFRLPVDRAPVPESSEPKRHPHGSPRELYGAHVLIVDDNQTNRRILRLQCEAFGMICRETASPHQALQWLREGQHFDVALVDHLMPEMDGLMLSKHMRILRDVDALKIVILTSALSMESAAREAGGDIQGMFTKPLHLSRLYDVLVDTLSKGNGTQRTLPSDEPARDASSPETLRVLLAEDNPVNQRVALLMLEKLGYHADVVATGAEALKAAMQASYDLILMDMLMPEMDGFEAARRIRNLLPKEKQPRIIAMTANALAGDRERCLDAGMDDYVSKPVRLEELAQALAACTRGIRLRKTDSDGSVDQSAESSAERTSPELDR
jgi:CheY-like chemotaxis protein/anti-sigma regulatory factor (Ser/Thr protein kinase)